MATKKERRRVYRRIDRMVRNSVSALGGLGTHDKPITITRDNLATLQTAILGIAILGDESEIDRIANGESEARHG